MGPASNFWMAAYFAGSFLSAFSTTSITGLKSMRREPIARSTVVSQPYFPSKPSTNGWKTPGATGRDDGFWMMDDGSGTGTAVWAWSVASVRRARQVASGTIRDRGVVRFMVFSFFVFNFIFHLYRRNKRGRLG